MDASDGRADRATLGCSLLNTFFTQLAATYLVVGVASHKPDDAVTFDNKDSTIVVTRAGGADNFRYGGHTSTPETRIRRYRASHHLLKPHPRNMGYH